MDKKGFYIETEIGDLTITEKAGAINGLYFGRKDIPEGYALEESELIGKCISQLREYFEGNRKEFELPLLMEGTGFQRRVWEALKTIPYGETRSYGDIARQVESPKAFRAVGGANHNNPVSIIVP